MTNKSPWGEIPIKKLVSAPWNYKVDDSDRAKDLKANIERNGQLENIIVRKIENGKYEVVNGNHRLDAFNDLKMKKVFCYNLGKVTIEESQRIAVETNETRFDSDGLALAKIIDGLIGDDGFAIEDLATTMPYSVEELEGFGELTDFNWDEIKEEPPLVPPEKGSGVIDVMAECPECKHKFIIDESNTSSITATKPQ